MANTDMSYQGAIEALAYALWMGHSHQIDVVECDSGCYGVNVVTGGPCGDRGRVAGNNGEEREFKHRKSAENLRDKIMARAKARAHGMSIRHASWKQRTVKIRGLVSQHMEGAAA